MFSPERNINKPIKITNMKYTQTSKEFKRGYSDATSKKRPWHVKTAKTSKRYDLNRLSKDYINGYSQGYAEVIKQRENREIKNDFFTKGYLDGINQRAPILREGSYVEGYALAKADKGEQMVKQMLQKAGRGEKYDEQKRLSLEEFFENKKSFGKFAIRYELGPTQKNLETKFI